MAHRVLIIDDEVGFSKLLKLNLEKSGRYEVCVDNDSQTALQTALDFLPNVILLDVVMPGRDGGDLAALFSQDPTLKDIPIMMLTALVTADSGSADTFTSTGAVTVIPKPVDLAELEGHLQKVLT